MDTGLIDIELKGTQEATSAEVPVSSSALGAHRIYQSDTHTHTIMQLTILLRYNSINYTQNLELQ